MPSPRHLRFILTLSVGVIAASTLYGVGFTAGNLVVYRVGDGSSALTSAATSVYLDEYSPSGGLVQSIAMPNGTAPFGSASPLTGSGTASSEGLLTLSPNGQYLTFTGYATPNSTVTGVTTSVKSQLVDRAVGIIGGNGVVDTSTTIPVSTGFTYDGTATDNPKSAVTTDGIHLWLAGGTSQIYTTTKGSHTATAITNVTFAGAAPSFTQVAIYGSQLYASNTISAKNGATVRLSTIGTGIPTIGTNPVTDLNGLSTSLPADADSFYFADLSTTVLGLDTLYVADDKNGLEKFCLLGSVWTAEGAIAPTTTFKSVHAVAGQVVGSNVNLFMTTDGGDTLFSYVDTTGFGNALPGTATVNTVATAGTNEVFRGVAFAPVPEPGTFAALALGLTTLGGWNRFRRNRRA